ncbi:MAG: oligosaccharide flippase family protein, partial [Eubacterium sp.]|nr:oligosaccharide flippase family protein [Eubacterium sp.]
MNQRKAGAMLSYVYLAITFLIGVVYTPLLLSFLGKSEYGVYSVAASTIAFLAILDLGFSQTMVRYVAKCKAEKDREGEEKLNGMFLLLYTGIALVALLAGIVIFFNLDFLFQKGFTPEETRTLRWIFIILLGNLVFSFPLGIFNSIISANEGFVFLKGMNIVSTLLTHGGILLALFMGFKSISMALITTVVSLGVKLIQSVYGRKKYKIRFRFSGFDRSLMK